MARLAAPAGLQNAYTEALPASRALADRARQLFPDAVTHDNRRMDPFPLYVDRAEGAYKWDVDGHRYVDYWMGHGALLLGHNPPAVRDAVREQALRGTHYGACHAREVEWGDPEQRNTRELPTPSGGAHPRAGQARMPVRRPGGAAQEAAVRSQAIIRSPDPLAEGMRAVSQRRGSWRSSG